jgi:urease accessory protein
MPVVPLPLRDRALEPTGAVGKIAPGTGRLEFTRIGGRTVLTRALASSPLKLLCPRRDKGSASVYLATYGGGLVGGDRIDLSMTIRAGAAAVVATQASTKVYRSPLGAGQNLHADVASGGLLVLLPDPVVCFAGATYRQEQRIRLDAGASLVLVDRLTAGRIEYGERWQFDEYASRILVWQGRRLLLHDALRLTRLGNDVARRLGRFNCLAVVVLVGPAVAETAARFESVVQSMGVTRRSDFLMSAAPLADHGAVVRIASRSVEALDIALRGHLRCLAALLGSDPWSGK